MGSRLPDLIGNAWKQATEFIALISLPENAAGAKPPIASIDSIKQNSSKIGIKAEFGMSGRRQQAAKRRTTTGADAAPVFEPMKTQAGKGARLAGLALAFLVAGCATTSSVTENHPVATPAPGLARIVFFRPGGIFGYAQRADILLDGKKVGKSAPGTKFYVDTAPGSHRVSVPNMMYSGERTLEVSAQSGQTVYVKTSLGAAAYGGRTDVNLVTPAEGAQETAALKLVSSP